jgi:prepilin-type N-terminal cleavage/methylation domain-containing protein
LKIGKYTIFWSKNYKKNALDVYFVAAILHVVQRRRKNMNRTRAGFTLMEIMVVIIVIAVLASVAGPMIGSITDQGRASATKSKMSALKSAMLAYQSDVGRLPFSG